MTSQSKVQGYFKALAVAAVAIVASLPSMDANAAPRGVRQPPRTVPVDTVRPPMLLTPPPQVVVVPPCQRGGPGITPC